MNNKKHKQVKIKDVLTKTADQIYDEGSKSQKIAIWVIFLMIVSFFAAPYIYDFFK